jgi:hypothetical protein
MLYPSYAYYVSYHRAINTSFLCGSDYFLAFQHVPLESMIEPLRRNSDPWNPHDQHIPTLCLKYPEKLAPISPRLELVHGSEVSDNGGAVPVSVTEVNFSYGDFQCPSCPQQFPTETNRQMHIESEHSSRPRQHEAYRSGANWYCKKCRATGDKFDMQETTCSGIKKK